MILHENVVLYAVVCCLNTTKWRWLKNESPNFLGFR